MVDIYDRALNPVREKKCPSPKDAPSVHLVENTLCDEQHEHFILGSDGLVRLECQAASCGCKMEEGEEAKGKITATFLEEHISSITPIRSEYKGIFRSITHMNCINTTPTEEDH